jgi:hypothetical protein
LGQAHRAYRGLDGPSLDVEQKAVVGEIVADGIAQDLGAGLRFDGLRRRQVALGVPRAGGKAGPGVLQRRAGRQHRNGDVQLQSRDHLYPGRGREEALQFAMPANGWATVDYVP